MHITGSNWRYGIVARQEKPAASKTGNKGDTKPRAAKNPMKTAAGGSMLALEPRILLDAALADTAAKVADAVSHDGTTPHIEARQVDKDIFKALAPMGREQIRREVIFVDSRTDNLKELLGKATPNRQVVVLSPNRDGVVQITRVLSRMQNVDAVHIFSHGDAGRIQLGHGELSIDNIQKYQKYLKAWASHMTNAADILIYGCDVAEGAKGADFVRILSELTQADVAASTDLTGEASQGGDWVLEKVVGHIESDVALTVHGREQFKETLATHPTDTTGALGTNLIFNGTDNYVTIADGSKMLGTSTANMTIEAWVKIDTLPAAGVMSVASAAYSTGVSTGATWELLIQSTGKILFQYKNNNDIAVSFSKFTSASNLNTGVWHHISVARNGTSAQIYIDGVANTTTGTDVAANTVAMQAQPVNIGARVIDGNGTRQNFFSGQIDEVRLWNINRSATDIAATTDVQLASETGGSAGQIADLSNNHLTAENFNSLVGYWKMDQAGGLDTTVAADSSGNTNGPQNGTLVGFTFNVTTSDWDNTSPTFSSSANVAMTAILEDAAPPSNGSPSGSTAVSSLLGAITDGDTVGSSGLAIRGITSGTLYFSTNGGSTWSSAINASTLSDTSAIVLTNNANNLLYYKPDANVNGTVNALTFRGWDGTDGIANGTTGVDITKGGASTAGTGPSPYSATIITVDNPVTAVNDAPTLTATGVDPGYTEGNTVGSVLFSAAASGIGTGDTGQSLDQLVMTLSNVGTGGTDEISFDGGTTWVNMTNAQSGVSAGTFATKTLTVAVSTAGGTATVTLSVAGGGLAATDMNSLVDGIRYRSTSTDPTASFSTRTATLTSIRDTGGTTNGGVDTTAVSIASTVNITAVNDAPTATTLTGTNPTFTEGAGTATGTAVALFSGSNISTVETGESVDQMIFTIGNLSDGSSEVVNIDGSAVTLTDGNSVPTATNGMTASVSVSGSTATITVSKSGGISTTAMNTLVNGITYENQSQVPTANASRVATITSLRDTGGSQTSNPAIASTITVAGTNDAPTMTLAPTASVSVGSPEVLDNSAVIADVELNAAINYNGSTLTIARQGGASVQDEFSAKTGGTLAALTETGNLTVGGTTVGTVTTNSGGTLVLTFNSNATQTLVNEVLTQIAYDNNTATSGTITLDAVFNDQNAGAQGGGGALSVTSSIDVTLTTGASASITAVSIDSGTSDTDYLTNDNTPTVSGTLSQALTGSQELRYSVDNGTSWIKLTTQPGLGTTWTTGTDIGTLGDGTIPFKIGIFADANPLTAATTSSAQSLVIDTVAPALTVTSKTFSADTGTPDDFITKTAAQTISGTLSGVTQTGEIVQVSLDNGNTWTTATNVIGQSTWSLAGQTLGGSDTMQVRVTDAAGNPGTAISQAYVLDTAAPAAPTTPVDLAAASDSGISSSDNLTNVIAPTFRVNLAGTNAAVGDTIELLLGGVSLTTSVTKVLNSTDVNTNGFVDLSVTSGELGASGVKTMTAVVTDVAGNIGTPGGSLDVTLDTVLPTVTDANIAITSTGTGTGGAYKIGDAITVQWTDTGGDNNTDTAAVTMDFSAFGGGSNVVATNNAGVWTASYTLAAGVLDNVTTANVAVTVTDNAGNSTTTPDTTGPTVDNVAPTTTISGITISADTGTPADFITKTAAQTIGATLSVPLGVGEVLWGSVNGGVSWTDISAMATGTAVSWTAATLATGSDSIVMKVTDGTGNDGATASQAYTLDTVAPSAAIFSPVTTNNNQPTISGTFESAALTNGGSFKLTGFPSGTLTLGTTPGFTNVGDTWTMNFATAGITLLDAGYDFDAVTTDGAGNVTTNTLAGGIGAQGILFVDTNTPETPPDPAFVSPTVNTLTTFSTTPTITGTVPALVAARLTTETAETFTVTVGGATYNVTPSTTVVTNITSPQPDTVYTWSLDLATATPATGSLSLSQGVTYNVVASIVDAAGNIASDSTTADLTIGTPDTIAPTAPTVTALSTQSSQPTITGSFNSADHAGGFTVTVNGTTYTLGTDPALTSSGNTWSLNLATSGQTLPEGAYTVTATAKDAAMNASNGTGSVIIDQTAPVAPAITGPIDGAKLTGTTTNITGTGEPGATMRVYDTDGVTLLGTTTVAGNGIWSLANVALASGDHTIHAKQTDAAGNVSPEKLVSFNVSAQNPSTLLTGTGGITPPTGQTAAPDSGNIGTVDAGTPVMDTVQQSLAEVGAQKIDISAATAATGGLSEQTVETTGQPGGEVNAAQNTLNAALNTPSGAGPARPGETGRGGPQQPTGERNSLNVSDALRGQITQLSPDSFEVFLPASSMNIGDIIYTATRADGSALPEYIVVDPVTGKVTINRDKAPLGVNKVDIKLSRIVQNGDLKDVKSASFGITVNKEARVNLGNDQQAPAEPPAPQG